MSTAMNEWFSVDASNVLSEVIDGEVMIIDMRLGNYYNLNGVAVAIWSALSEPRRLEDIVELVRRRYIETPSDLAAQVQRFVEELASEQLVSRLAAAPRSLPTPAAADSAAAEPYRTPVLEKYTDMQALLLVDPIHDVDVLGWPKVKRS